MWCLFYSCGVALVLSPDIRAEIRLRRQRRVKCLFGAVFPTHDLYLFPPMSMCDIVWLWRIRTNDNPSYNNCSLLEYILIFDKPKNVRHARWSSNRHLIEKRCVPISRHGNALNKMTVVSDIAVHAVSHLKRVGARLCARCADSLQNRLKRPQHWRCYI